MPERQGWIHDHLHLKTFLCSPFWLAQASQYIMTHLTSRRSARPCRQSIISARCPSLNEVPCEPPTYRRASHLLNPEHEHDRLQFKHLLHAVRNVLPSPENGHIGCSTARGVDIPKPRYRSFDPESEGESKVGSSGATDSGHGTLGVEPRGT